MPLTTYVPGEVLTAASLNANLSFAASSPAGGLTLISATTIGTTVSSVTVSSAFSATYDNYRIIVSGGIASASIFIDFKLGSTTTGYYLYSPYGVYNSTTQFALNTNNGASFTNTISGSANSLSGIIEISNPFETKRTHLYSEAAQSLATTGTAIKQSGFLDNATSYTAFTLTPQSGTLTGGTIRVYGYANS